MRLPWFMHMHAGRNSLTGVLPTPVGTFVRSCADGRMEVAWYPMDHAFAGGDSRECRRLAVTDATDDGERRLEDAVLDFMHSHPVLAMQVGWDHPAGSALEWVEAGGGALATYEHPNGLFFRIHHGGVVTLEFLPIGGHGRRETLGTFADSCGEHTLGRRVDARVRRRIAEAETRVTAKAA